MAESAAGNDDPRSLSIDDALEALRNASRTAPKQRTIKVTNIVDPICDYAFQHGLDAWSLESVVDVVTIKTQLDQTSVTTLIKNLYPAVRIPSGIVVRVVGALGQGKLKPSPPSQISLVRWLTNILGALEEPSVISRFYGVLFNMLDMITLRTPLCHLLSTITRRKHVRPFRIQQLLELVRVNANEPALVGLLQIYKDYYPDVIVGNFIVGKGSLPPQPDSEWQQRIQAIQDSERIQQDASSGEQNGFKVARQIMKRGRVGVIPEVHTSYAQESSVTLEEINSVDELVARLEKVEPPNRLVSCFRDPLVQKYLNLADSGIHRKRVTLWVSRYFNEELESLRSDLRASENLSEVLLGLLSFTRYTGELMAPAASFLEHFLSYWDGVTDANTILGLLSYLRLSSFEELHTIYLVSLERAILSSDINAHSTLLDFYTELLRRQMTEMLAKDGKAVAQTPRDGRQCFTDLATYASKLASTALIAASPGSAPASSVLVLFELLSDVACSAFAVDNREIIIVLPSADAVYAFALGSSLSELSRLCAVLTAYKHAFDGRAKAGHRVSGTLAEQMNGFLTDACNLLWRARALMSTNASASGCLCPPNIVDPLSHYLVQLDSDHTLSSSFGLSSNPALCAVASSTWHEMLVSSAQETDGLLVRHIGPVSEQLLNNIQRQPGAGISWRQYRVEILNWLEERGACGIKELMYATMKELIKTTT